MKKVIVLLFSFAVFACGSSSTPSINISQPDTSVDNTQKEDSSHVVDAGDEKEYDAVDVKEDLQEVTNPDVVEVPDISTEDTSDSDIEDVKDIVPDNQPDTSDGEVADSSVKDNGEDMEVDAEEIKDTSGDEGTVEDLPIMEVTDVVPIDAGVDTGSEDANADINMDSNDGTSDIDSGGSQDIASEVIYPIVPCNTDADCSFGFCTETSAGKICAIPCNSNADCVNNEVCMYVKGGNYCIDPQPRRCMPCNDDDDCQREDLDNEIITPKCVMLDPEEGSFCVYQCTDTLGCSNGYSCKNSSGFKGCFPDNNRCGCSPLASELQAETTCFATGVVNKCSGTRQCMDNGTLSACKVDPDEIEDEVCDGVDNDCDGQTDEGENLDDCVDYYADKDHDNYPSKKDKKCLCNPMGAYVFTEDNVTDWDCDDSNPAVYPNSPNSVCGEDANCDGNYQDNNEQCDDGNNTSWDGCTQCKVSEVRVDQSVLHAVIDDFVLSNKDRYTVLWSQAIYENGKIKDSILLKQYGADNKVTINTKTIKTQTNYLILGLDGCNIDDQHIALTWFEAQFNNDGEMTYAYPKMAIIKFENGGIKIEKTVSLPTDQSGLQFFPKVACNKDSLLTAWTRKTHDYMGDKYSVNYRLFKPNGDVLTDQSEISGYTEADFNPDVAPLDKDRFVLVYVKKGVVIKGFNASCINKNGVQEISGHTLVQNDNPGMFPYVFQTGPNEFLFGYVAGHKAYVSKWKREKKPHVGFIFNRKVGPTIISNHNCSDVLEPYGTSFIYNGQKKYVLAYSCVLPDKDIDVYFKVLNSDLSTATNPISPGLFHKGIQKEATVAGINNQFMVVWLTLSKVIDKTVIPTAIAQERFNGKGQPVYP